MLAKGWSNLMPVILINPNSTEAMTESALEAARLSAPDLEFEGWTSTAGPVVIEGAKDGALAIPPLLELVRKASEKDPTAIIIACFDDTGLAQAQEVAKCPVIGIGQASFIFAALMSGQTAIITTVAEAVPVISANILDQGHAKHISLVEAAHVPVLTLSNNPSLALEKFVHAANQLPDDTRNIILGCSGVVSIRDDFAKRVAPNVIDGVTAAARLCRAFETL